MERILKAFGWKKSSLVVGLIGAAPLNILNDMADMAKQQLETAVEHPKMSLPDARFDLSSYKSYERMELPKKKGGNAEIATSSKTVCILRRSRRTRVPPDRLSIP